MRAWLTPDNEPDGKKCIRLVVPSGNEWEAIIRGALALLFDTSNFEEFGSVSVDDTVDVFLDCMGQWMNWEGCVSVGTVLYTAGNTLPDRALWCNGAQVLQADYPVLYAEIGDTWGSADSGYFRLPDMRDSFPMGCAPVSSGSYAVGDTGGEDTHTLTTAEMPSHVHAIQQTVLPVQAGAGAMVSAVGGGFIYTGTTSTGSGNAHNNLPPYAGLNAYIIAQ